MLRENMLFGYEDKVKIAIDRIKQFCPPEGYYLAFSGGKDSIVIKELVKMAEVKHDCHFNLTTVDPPELIYFIRKYHKDVEVIRPELSMFKLIEKKKYPPTRLSRYCCQVLKEGGGVGRFVVTGIRWEESNQRSNRKMVEVCMREKTKKFLHPIIDWTEKEVWQFIRERQLPYPSLYDNGYKRIGCIGCPMSYKPTRIAELDRYPQVKKQYIKSFGEVITRRLAEGKKCTWKTGQEMYDWWISA